LGAVLGSVIPAAAPLAAPEFRSVTSLLLAFAMAMLLNERSRRQQEDRQRLQQELAAAAEMQSLLVPGERVESPLWQSEAAYLPAAEVGGDFHYSLRDGDALVVVCGDVSGKGLRAAMLVTMIVGVLRDTAEREPASLLRALDRALAGQAKGGFVTCCCARFEPDGRVRIANAGHLAPYVDGQALELPSLPLALPIDCEPVEAEVSGERFTFVSDGVVEAANDRGELFGFDRIREISGRPAREIAEAARQWGQNDDITAVTIRRTL
jgi:serine phosphatase RsbU (regulator of sigma subunit)